ncbi:helix-turn-helix domain-containing protein [Halarchaeum sp. P4]|uniref:helix-turn-helix domain-containing protein n=1 Tax=Halarchaeum sp. P4 TaxID=3421639 RepID=UPI003EBEE7AE
MTDMIHVHTDPHRTREQDDTTTEHTADPDVALSTADVLGALDDADCRAMLEALDEPRSARDLIERCDIPSSTAYRKLDRLADAGLIAEQSSIQKNFRQVSLYVRTFESINIVAADDTLAVEIESRDGSPSGRLSEMWSQVQREV